MSLHQRLERLEAVHRRPAAALPTTEQAELSEDVRRVLRLAPPGVEDRASVLREWLRDFERGTRSDETLARVGGVNLEVLRVVSRLESSY